MNKLILLTIGMLLTFNVGAAEKKSGQWQPTTLSEETIDKVQKAKYKYMQCITVEVQQQAYVKMDTRVATDKILQQCEKSLSHVRTVFAKEKVPEEISGHYLKSTRNQTARMVLQQLMYNEADRKARKPG